MNWFQGCKVIEKKVITNLKNIKNNKTKNLNYKKKILSLKFNFSKNWNLKRY